MRTMWAFREPPDRNSNKLLQTVTRTPCGVGSPPAARSSAVAR
jgi:hypothetical protein